MSVTNEHWYAWFVLIAGHFICLRSWLVTMCDLSPVVGISSMVHATCGTGPYLPSWAFVSNSSFNGAPVAQTLVSNVNHWLPFVFPVSLSLSLIFVLRYVGSGYTDVVFRFSLCLLGLKVSLSLLRNLYFAVICILIRLHQSKKAHSTTWQALLICKYQIISIFPCCNLQNMNIFNQWSFIIFRNYMGDVNMKRKSLSHDGQQLPLTSKSLTTIKTTDSNNDHDT
jgi:hypothetical protein